MQQHSEVLRVVVAPDSYKESLSAAAAAKAMSEGILEAAPEAEVIAVPMADGGEGSLAAVLAATGGERMETTVRDANGQLRAAAWAWLEDESAFIEMAEAAGLEHIPPDDRRPLQASTYGVGELVLAAVDAGARHIVIGLGGSATTDGGAGLLQALGVRLYDAEGGDLPPGGAALNALAGIDTRGLDQRVQDVTFEIAVDVSNPLTGPTGAAYVFGPQKGANAQDVAVLDKALTHFAQVCEKHTGRLLVDMPGAGAAGGLGYAIKSFFEAEFRPGVELIAELTHLDDALNGAALVFTGEGRVDAQTLSGKTPAGVIRRAVRHGADVICLAGALEDGYSALYEIGLTAAFSLTPGPVKLRESYERAASLLRERTRDCMRLWLAGRARGGHDKC